MKILTNFMKRGEVVVSIIVFIGVIYISAPVRYFLAWHSLPTPPEPAERIISATYLGDVTVRTFSNKKLTCNIYSEEECWTEIDGNPWDMSTSLCFMKDCPNNEIVQMKKTTIQNHNFGESTTIYSLNDKGVVSIKQTGFIYYTGYMIATMLAAICAFIVFIGKHILVVFIASLRKEAVK